MAVNATLPLEAVHSKFRGPPGPELDKAWEDIARTHLFPLSREELIRMGKDPDYTVLMPEEFGFGAGHHAGFMDVFHNIHCLDFLRREVYSDYYGESSKSPLGRQHLDHCIEILLEELMCRPNMGVITYRWMDGHPMPVPDFVQKQKCWNFDEVTAWKDSHGHINDRGFYEDYYAKLRNEVKQTPLTPGWEKLTKEEELWLSRTGEENKHSHQ